MSSIDLRKLRRDAARAEKERPLPSVGRETTGAVRLVRDLLPAIREMRERGLRWAAIADALAAQGVHQLIDGERRPLTANRLTAIVSAVERQATRSAGRTRARRNRPGLVAADVDPETVAGSSTQRVALSPELQPDPNDPGDTDTPSHASEEELRRSRLDAVRRLTRE